MVSARRRRVRPCGRLGAVAVEFALVLPLLLLIVGGAMSWGRVLSREVLLVQVARDAALAGARTGSDDGPADVAMARAQEGLEAAGFDCSAATITVTPVALAAGSAIEVRIEVAGDHLVDVVPLPDRLIAATIARLDDQ